MSLKNSLVLLIVACIFASCKKSTPDPKSSQKEIISFIIKTTPHISGAIDPVKNTITISLPMGTNLTNITPTIEVSPMATISPASGIAQDFSKPVVYTITAEDGSQQTMLVIGEFIPDPINFISYNEDKYKLTYGSIGTTDFNLANFVQILDVNNPDSTNIGIGLVYSKELPDLRPGTYTFAENSYPILDPKFMYGWVYQFCPDRSCYRNPPIASGKISVEKTEDIYRLTFNVALANGDKVRGNYLGKLLKSKK